MDKITNMSLNRTWNIFIFRYTHGIVMIIMCVCVFLKLWNHYAYWWWCFTYIGTHLSQRKHDHGQPFKILRWSDIQRLRWDWARFHLPSSFYTAYKWRQFYATWVLKCGEKMGILFGWSKEINKINAYGISKKMKICHAFYLIWGNVKPNVYNNSFG